MAACTYVCLLFFLFGRSCLFIYSRKEKMFQSFKLPYTLRLTLRHYKSTQRFFVPLFSPVKFHVKAFNEMLYEFLVNNWSLLKIQAYLTDFQFLRNCVGLCLFVILELTTRRHEIRCCIVIMKWYDCCCKDRFRLLLDFSTSLNYLWRPFRLNRKSVVFLKF